MNVISSIKQKIESLLSNTRPELLLIVSAGLLIMLGLLMIYSASSIVALKEFDNQFHYLIAQARFIAIGLILLIIASIIPYRTWSTPAVWVAWLITTVLLLTTFFVGLTGGGATRWVSIGGFSLQPTEFAKITSVLILANIVAQYRQGRIALEGLAVLTAVGVLIPMVLIFIQPDLGSIMIVLITLVVMLYLSGFGLKRIIKPAIVIGIFGLLAILIEPYRRSRLISAFDPWVDPQGKGYQVIQGFYAFSTGGLTGLGLGNSHQKFFYLPEAHTDFIFAIIGEELGLIGALVTLLIYALFIYAGYKIMSNANDTFGKMVAGGMTTLIAVQACLNILCVIGFFPVTGKPLPFLSYGGSSLVASMAMVGILLSVARGSTSSAQAERTRESFEVIENRAPQRKSSDTALKVINFFGRTGQNKTKESQRRRRREESSLKDSSSSRRRTKSSSSSRKRPRR